MGNLGSVNLEKLLRSIVELDIEFPNAKERNSGYILLRDGSCFQIRSVRHDRIAFAESFWNQSESGSRDRSNWRTRTRESTTRRAESPAQRATGPGRRARQAVAKDEKFQEVISQMGTTRAQVQQTELAFLTPPTPKNKARFMNLSGIIDWMTMMLWLLRNSHAKCLAGVDADRFQKSLAGSKTMPIRFRYGVPARM